MQELRQGSVLQGGKYRIEKVLGQGGFGITYQARMRTTVAGDIGQMDVDVNVAIKEFFLKEQCVRDESTSRVSIPTEGGQELVALYRNKFIKEAQNLAHLNHPHIVKVTHVFEENGTVYYVMQYLPGGSLSAFVRRQPQGRLPEAEALRYIREVGEALQYMHETSHTCHLDVKPGNILLDANQQAVLIDFGLAKNYDETGNQTSSTPVGVSKGYAPLEQYQQALKSFSPQTDVYSLGATLYFFLTGTTPPEASEVNEEGLPPCPADVSPAVWSVIDRAMQPRRRDRYASVADLLAALPGASHADATVVDFPPVVPPSPDAPDTRPSRPTQPVGKAPSSGVNLKYLLVGIVAAVVPVGLVLLLRGHGATSGGDVADILDGDTMVVEFLDSVEVSRGEWTEDLKILDPNGNLAYTYNGYAVGSTPEGRGTAVYPTDDSEGRKKYEGNFENGQRHGQGVLSYRNGDTFTGTFNMGHFQTGTYKVAADGSTFTGTFKGDAPYDGIWLDANGKTLSHVTNGKER